MEQEGDQSPEAYQSFHYESKAKSFCILREKPEMGKPSFLRLVGSLYSHCLLLVRKELCMFFFEISNQPY